MATLALNPKRVRVLPGGIVSPQVMFEASQVGRNVFVGTDGLLREAAGDSNALATGQVGLIVAGGQAHDSGVVDAGETVTVLWLGRVNLGVTLDPSEQYHLANSASGVKGLFGDAPGTVARRLGKPLSPDGLFFYHPQDIATAP